MHEETYEPEATEITLPTVLGALADPARLALIRAAHELGEARCGDVSAHSGLGLSKSTVSHHLKVLREAGLMHARMEGTSKYVSIRHDDMETACPGLLHAVIGEHNHAEAASTS